MSPLPDPRLSAAILAARSARFASRTLKTGGGSTVPGVVARRVDPRVLTKLSRRLRMGSAAITGTNGKTTTTRMVSRILRSAGIRAVNNSTGANLVTGVTAALVADTGLSGAPSSEMGLFEVDEASVPRVAAEAEIKILAVLNLFRDQLDRYGELAYTGKVIASAFGDLPQSGAVVLYETVYMGHVGLYDCRRCDFSRPESAYRASRVRLQGAQGSEFLLSSPNGEANVRLGLPGLYNVYNALAAAAVAGESGIGLAGISRGLREFGGAFGRVERVKAGDREAFLLLIKNPVGFNEILPPFVTGAEARHVLIAINDNDADGRDVSWLWDVDFEMLAEARAEGVADAAPFTVSGIRADDMAVRLKYAELPVGPVIPDRAEA